MEQEIISALQVVLRTFGRPIAEQVEKVVRNETSHFKSKGWINLYCPGMESFSNIFPYGWTIAESFWRENTSYKPINIVSMTENSSAMMNSRGERKFLQFKTIEGALMTMAYILNERGGDGGAWFSVNEAIQRKKYNDYLKLIIPKFTNKIK